MGSLGVQRGQGGAKYGVRTGCGLSQLSHRHLFYSQASVPVKAQGVEDYFFITTIWKKCLHTCFLVCGYKRAKNQQ